MTKSGEALPSPSASEEKKRRGRPRQSGTETQKQRIERLQDELRQAQEALRVSEERRASIVGAAALRHIRRNTEFARQLAAMLRAEIKAKADRATIADLLLDPVSTETGDTDTSGPDASDTPETGQSDEFQAAE